MRANRGLIAVIGLTLLAAALAISALGGIGSASGPHDRRHAHHHRRNRLQRAMVAEARPVWSGDRFRVVRGGTFHRGTGALPPYLWSSAWEEGRGFLAHSDLDPNLMGVTMQPDPTGLGARSSRSAPTSRSTMGATPAWSCAGPSLFTAGMNRLGHL